MRFEWFVQQDCKASTSFPFCYMAKDFVAVSSWRGYFKMSVFQVSYRRIEWKANNENGKIFKFPVLVLPRQYFGFCLERLRCEKGGQDARFPFLVSNREPPERSILTPLRIKVVSLLNAFRKQLRINSIVNRWQLKLYRHWNYSALFSSLIRPNSARTRSSYPPPPPADCPYCRRPTRIDPPFPRPLNPLLIMDFCFSLASFRLTLNSSDRSNLTPTPPPQPNARRTRTHSSQMWKPNPDYISNAKPNR